MRKIFNGVTGLFKSPTKALNKELVRFEFEQGPPPSVNKVRELIKKGADVNAPANAADGWVTPLSRCAYLYKNQMFRSGLRPDQGVEIRNGDALTPEDYKAAARRYFDVAKVLIEAGADPRGGLKVANGQPFVDMPMFNLTCLINDTSIVKEFGDLLTTASAAADKRDATNKPKTPKPGSI